MTARFPIRLLLPLFLLAAAWTQQASALAIYTDRAAWTAAISATVRMRGST